MNKALRRLAQNALNVQNASNLVGLAQGFCEALQELRELENLDDAALSNHPVTLAWVDKLASVTGTQCLSVADTTDVFERLSSAYKTLYSLAERGQHS